MKQKTVITKLAVLRQIMTECDGWMCRIALKYTLLHPVVKPPGHNIHVQSCKTLLIITVLRKLTQNAAVCVLCNQTDQVANHPGKPSRCKIYCWQIVQRPNAQEVNC